MRRVEAEFCPTWRPGRGMIALLALLGICVALSVGTALWGQWRVTVLKAQIAQLSDDARRQVRTDSPRHVPMYDASARLFLRERDAAWAPMFRTLESGAMVGVTPISVEFNAMEGSARVELNYVDSTALLDYLGRINEGVSSSAGVPRWNLVETRMQPSANSANTSIQNPTRSSDSLAVIRSNWLGSTEHNEAPVPAAP